MAALGTIDVCKKRGCICAVGPGIQMLVDMWKVQLENLVSEQMKQNLVKRNGVSSYHCTLVSSTEMKNIDCAESVIQHFQTIASSCFPVALGIGKLQQGKNEQAFFLILKWPEANGIRVAQSLEEKNFHVTLGFTRLDIHQNEKKGVASLIPYFNIPYGTIQSIYYWSTQEKIMQQYPETTIDSLSAIIDHCSHSSNIKQYNELEAKARLERAVLFGRQGIKDRCLRDALLSIELKPTPRGFLILGDAQMLVKNSEDANISYQKGFALCKKTSRIRSSLFKKLQTGDDIKKRESNFKFPRTKHMFDFGGATRDDLLLPVSEYKDFCSDTLRRQVTVEEKIDGANLGIYFTDDGELVTKNRSKFICSQSSTQWKGLDTWLAKHCVSLRQILGNRYILYGEWLLAKHSIHYTCLPDYFIAFDIFCKISKRFLSVACRNKMLANTGIKVVRRVTTIPVFTAATIEVRLKELLRQEPSHYYRGKVEGLVLRSDEEDDFNGDQISFLINRTKIVQADFIQGIDEHWTRNNFEKNIIAFQHGYENRNRETEQEFAKYPRTPKFLFSPNYDSDDIPYNPQDAPMWFNEYVITEKIDGGNCCLKNGKVYARSHNTPATHWSFDRIKELYASIYMLNPIYKTYGPELELYGENVTAVHSIEYDNLSSPLYLFAAKMNDNWLSWGEVVNIADAIGIPHVPMIFEGNENNNGNFSLTNIEKMLKLLANQTSQLSTSAKPEGFVVRKREGFSEANFQYCVAKYVRKEHVQTDINWKTACKKATIRPSKPIKALYHRNDYLLFVDLDGVLADFDKGIEGLTGKSPQELANSQMWKAIKNAQNFFGTLDWMPDAKQFWEEGLSRRQPTILTGIPEDESKWAERQKTSWCHKHLGGDVPVICCLSKDKHKYAGLNRILIDDRSRNGRAWEKNGGIFILHTSVQNSIEQLKKLYGDCNSKLDYISKDKEVETKSKTNKPAKPMKPSYNLVMLVGVPGSGKSTFARSLEKRGYYRLSQDVVGSRKRCEELIGSLCKRQSVVLDRCNVEERDRKYWLSLSMCSKKRTVAVFFDRKVDQCAKSVVQRVGHETIKTKNIQNATKIVRSFQKNLTPPSTKEGFVEVYRVTTFQQASEILEKL